MDGGGGEGLAAVVALKEASAHLLKGLRTWSAGIMERKRHVNTIEERGFPTR